ncbi:MAG TPA: aspartate dehydrogenase [Candidatus Acidoferrales bacterium]|jgi:aspartate dehydrogenase|nr:aspartate dehydrogenase [Candidatus Acidoferrales bacterium]
MLKIGLLGVGAIGKTIATALDQKQLDAELVALSDQDCARAKSLSAELASHPPVVPLDEMIERCELAVEAASQAALPEFVPKALARGRDVLIMSVGGLLGHEEWFRQARENGCHIYAPSGAIAGLDGIKSASIGRIESAVLTSRKPVAALKGSKYVVDRDLPLETYKEDTVIFEGLAEEAARAFPATSNVAASLRLAVDPLLPVPVRVRVVAVPGGNENVHEIRVQGEFGRLTVKVENVPSKSNPRTSQLAAFSAIATLKNLTRSLRVGS